MNVAKFHGLRADLAFIAHWVQAGSRVLDLGCGDGAMLDYLQVEKQCVGYGVEIDDTSIPRCIDRGVSVIQQDIEAGLAMFTDDAFDSVLCLSALQMMKDVEGVLRDINRVGHEAIVSFPNFGHIDWPYCKDTCPFQKVCPMIGLIHLIYVAQRLATLNNSQRKLDSKF